MTDPQNRLTRFSASTGSGADSDVDGDRPYIHIHVLTEFEYCSRAGLVAHESDPEDTGQEPGGTVLDYLPFYELREIRRQINRLINVMIPWLLAGLVVLIVTLVSMLLISRLFAISGVIAILIVGTPPFLLMRRVIILSDRKKQAENTPGRAPNEESPMDETIGWWEIRKANFEATSYRDTLIVSQIGLRGKPHKVLRRDDLVIPVFFSNGGELKHQHYVRIAGYCRLVEHRELARSPYGLIVEKGTYVCHVVKNTSKVQTALQNALRDARRVIREEAATGEPPLPPKSPGQCKKCPIGYPQRYCPGETELVCKGITMPVHGLRAAKNGPIFHSQCGDRFGSMPPHRRVAEMGLKETV